MGQSFQDLNFAVLDIYSDKYFLNFKIHYAIQPYFFNYY